MNVLRIANLLNILCYLFDGVQQFHYGFLEDVGVDQDNNYDTDREKGGMWPKMMMLPTEGTWDVKASKETFNLELRLYDVFGVSGEVVSGGNDERGDLRTFTKATHWELLCLYMYTILKEFSKGDFGDGVQTFSVQNIEWFQDMDVANNTLIYVGVTMTISSIVVCENTDFDFGSLPDEMVYPVAVGGDDLEEARIDAGGGEEPPPEF